MINQLKLYLTKLPTLRKEIAIIIILKIAVIYLLWMMFFSHPIADHLSAHDILHHLIS